MADLTRPVSVVPQIVDAPQESTARGFTEVKIIGVGGGGSNAVNRMVAAGLEGVEFLIANPDNQALRLNGAPNKIQTGRKLTKLGRTSFPFQVRIRGRRGMRRLYGGPAP